MLLVVGRELGWWGFLFVSSFLHFVCLGMRTGGLTEEEGLVGVPVDEAFDGRVGFLVERVEG